MKNKNDHYNVANNEECYSWKSILAKPRAKKPKTIILYPVTRNKRNYIRKSKELYVDSGIMWEELMAVMYQRRILRNIGMNSGYSLG